jgi:L-malate glycosyltransferase
LLPMPKVILISQVALPFSNIGSWTTLYKNYIENNHQIDYIVCEKPDYQFPNLIYCCIPENWSSKILKKIARNPYKNYLKALGKILKSDEKYIIQIIDNFGIVKPLQEYLIKNNLRKNCYLQFFYHGFPPFYGNFESRFFFETIDEMVLLTYDSYQEHKKQYTVLPCRFSFLHNGIDTTKFCAISKAEKLVLKQKHNVLDKKVLVWCSQDRPKKGLHMVLDAWKRVFAKHNNCVLWVIGCEEKVKIDGVQYWGRIANDKLPEYLQTSDCYLFPTLWHEGFGMSLIEALHCGNYCIASSIGGVPEVLQYGKLGKLIENPHFVHEWEQAMLEFIENPLSFPVISPDLYSATSWTKGMNTIIETAKKLLQ